MPWIQSRRCPPRPEPRALPLILLILMLLGGTGCQLPSGTDIQLASLAQKQEHFELIRAIQPRLDRGEAVPSSQLLFLVGAYAQTRNYARLFPACDLLDAQIRRGDRKMFTGDLAPMPHYIRAQAWLDLGDPSRAAQEAQAAVDILARATGSDSFRVNSAIESWGALGIAQAVLHHPAQARACLGQLESLNVAGGIDGPGKCAALARIHMAMGSYELALAAIRQPEAHAGGLVSLFYDNTFQMVPLAYMEAKSLLETGRIAEARAAYDKLLGHPRLEEVGGLYWPVLLDRARIARLDQDDAMAERLLREAVAVVEAQRASIATETGRIGFVGDKQACYQELVALLVDHGRAGDAFQLVERAKGRALVDLLASQKLLAPPALEATLGRLAQAEAELAVVQDPGRGAASASRGVAIQARLDLVRAAPELASLVSVPGVSLEAIQARLEPDETLLEYYLAGPAGWAFLVTRSGIEVVPIDPAGLDGKVRAMRRLCSAPGAGDDAGTAAGLSRQLLAPVLGHLRGGTLTIVPHGVLHHLPFCALPAGDGLLVDRFSLRMLPSASVLGYLKPRKPVVSALILGNPDLGDPAMDLRNAQAEAQDLAAILAQPSLFLGKEATAARVLASHGRYGIIHLAAHGFFDEASPLDSGILLAPDPSAAGTLKVADLYHLDLDADLVTLSACETALAAVSRGDDVVGFTRGLLFAGSRSILSSLWKVDDQATRELMLDFYRNLDALGKAGALRHAQLEVRRANPHPYYWAAFMMTGNTR